MIEIFRNTNYDFLGKKWLCIGFSCVLLLLGVASIVWRAVDGNPTLILSTWESTSRAGLS
jgi:hypothetical protein